MNEAYISPLAGADARKRAWLKLDNAGKIYPATYSKTQNHLYRLSATLSDEVDRALLRASLEAVMPRFPSIAVSLHRGFFWYFLEPITEPPPIDDEGAWPFQPMSFKRIRKCGFRVLVSGRKLALEFFHAITDGGGALCFLKTLLAEYVERKYGARVPCTDGVLDRAEPPKAEELEDCFVRFAGPVAAKRAAVKSYHLSGTMEPDGYITYTTLSYDTKQVVECAREHQVSVTGLLCAVMMMAIINVQASRKPRGKKRDIAVCLPVNLRRFYPSCTLRNFSLYATPYLDPNQGEWTFQEICARVAAQMGERITKKEMAACVATNVRIEQMYVVRLMPLPLKKLAMKFAYHVLGNDACSLSVSNLGAVKLPKEMTPYVKDVDCLMDSHADSVSSCCAISCGERLHVNFCRCIRESTLEYEFYKVLRDLGLRAEVNSNGR